MNNDKRCRISAVLKQIVKDEYPGIDISGITEDTVLGSELGIDSLEMMLLMVRIEEACQIKFDSFPYVKTFGDLLTLIDGKQQ